MHFNTRILALFLTALFCVAAPQVNAQSQQFVSIAGFRPALAASRMITVSAASQSVDITSNELQVRIVNTSTSSVAVKIAQSAGGALTAAFTDGNGIIIPPGGVEVFTRPSKADRFAVIGLAANGYVQITPGASY